MAAGFGPDDLIACYRRGVFPMAESREDPTLFLVDPEQRGIIPLAGFHVPRRLARTIRSDTFRFTIDRAFLAVLDGCASPAAGRQSTWINPAIRSLYGALHQRGFAHSVEAWRGEVLAGGLYGVAIGAAFFGESMFSLQKDASKAALTHLVARLKVGGFRLLDTQFLTDHLSQFGAVTIPRRTFHIALKEALAHPADFTALPEGLSGAQLLQSIAQTS